MESEMSVVGPFSSQYPSRSWQLRLHGEPEPAGVQFVVRPSWPVGEHSSRTYVRTREPCRLCPTAIHCAHPAGQPLVWLPRAQHTLCPPPPPQI